MRARLLVLVVVLLTTATACGVGDEFATGCTMMGCDSQVSVRLGGVSLHGKAGVVTVTMCFDGACDEQRQRFKASGASFGRQGSQVSVEAFRGDTVASLRLPAGNYDETTEHAVSVQVQLNDDKPVKIERSVKLTRGQPNGADCDPVCWQATIEA